MGHTSVYLDNAATTPLDPAVLEAMMPFYTQLHGNPSSIHAYGRQVKAAIEKARRTVATLLDASPSEIFFTSGGTEADNFALTQSIFTLGIKQVITSRVEHHAVLHTLQHWANAGLITLHFVQLDELGFTDMSHLESLLQAHPGALVSLMHGNNEIGNLNDLNLISALCQQYGAIFHSDTVQTMGHYPLSAQVPGLHFMVGAAHKFHGPKGAGFLYMSSNSKLKPLLHGGSQERNMRGGTENVAGIIGLATALELAVAHQDSHRSHVESLKAHMIQLLQQQLPGVQFNGGCTHLDRSLYTVLNVSLPPNQVADMLLFSLDIAGIAASGGSACSSGSEVGSHVLQAINADPCRSSVRFSFSKFNTQEEVTYVVDKLAAILSPQNITV